jgi:NTP pyrophosphatase (non-canonical NTP hydrolase)
MIYQVAACWNCKEYTFGENQYIGRCPSCREIRDFVESDRLDLLQEWCRDHNIPEGIVKMKSWEHDQTAAALNALAGDIYNWAKGKGFWESTNYEQAAESWSKAAGDKMRLINKTTKIMLVVTELAELVEGLRKPPETKFDGNACYTNEEEEVADAIIRLLDYAGAYGLRIGEALCAKMTKNEGRPFRHGKEF